MLTLLFELLLLLSVQCAVNATWCRHALVPDRCILCRASKQRREFVDNARNCKSVRLLSPPRRHVRGDIGDDVPGLESTCSSGSKHVEEEKEEQEDEESYGLDARPSCVQGDPIPNASEAEQGDADGADDADDAHFFSPAGDADDADDANFFSPIKLTG